MENVISIQNLNKSFGNVKAVDDLSFRVKRGELFAFLGVNGAGKSTTISIICGQLKKDSGSVRIHEMDVERKGEETKRLLGVVFQDSVLDRPLTVKENRKAGRRSMELWEKAFEKTARGTGGASGFQGVFKPAGGQALRRSAAKNQYCPGASS